MIIDYLCDHIDCAETVAKWVYDEFIDGIRDDMSYADVLSEIKNCHKSKLPIRLVALDGDKCAGTVSIVFNDLKCRDYTPWLAALYVAVEHRSHGIGRQLIDRVKKIVADLGYKELYLRTEHTGGYYRKLGWTFIEECDDDFDLKPEVYMCKL